jgi:hypothetical protein
MIPRRIIMEDGIPSFIGTIIGAAILGVIIIAAVILLAVLTA